MIFCGIGSRETPSHILDEMFKFGEWVRKQNHTIRSGHAPGADWAFEQGSQERCIAYLPWETFNKDLQSKSHKVVIADQQDYEQYTKKFHPNISALSQGAIRLMNRNVCQVLGVNLNKPADFIICWTKDGKDSGGTGQALRIGKSMNIPILNMFYDKYNTCEKLVENIWI